MRLQSSTGIDEPSEVLGIWLLGLKVPGRCWAEAVQDRDAQSDGSSRLELRKLYAAHGAGQVSGAGRPICQAYRPARQGRSRQMSDKRRRRPV